MVQLQKDLERISATNTQLVAISYDPVAVLGAFARKMEISYPLLSDADSKIIDAYGVRNEAAKGRMSGIPHPVTFVIDRQGVIRARLPGTVPMRHSTDELLRAIGQIPDPQ